MKTEILTKCMYLITALILLFGVVLLFLEPSFLTLLIMIASFCFTTYVGLTKSNFLYKKEILMTNPVVFPEVYRNKYMNDVEFKNKYHDLVLETINSIKRADELQKEIKVLRTEIETKYIGNISTKKYHIHNCKFIKAMKKKNKVSLINKTQAVRAHFKACSCIN